MVNHVKDDKNPENEFEDDFNFNESSHDVDPLIDEGAQPHEIDESLNTAESMEPTPVKQKNMMLPIVIGVIVVAFIGWKAIGALSKKNSDNQPLTKQETVASKPKSSFAPQSTPQHSIPNLEEAEQQAKQAELENAILQKLKKELDNFQLSQKQQLDLIKREIELSEQNALNANKHLGNFQHDLANLSVSIQNLMVQVKALQDQQALARAKEEEKERRARLAAEKPTKISPDAQAYTTPSLNVHAIIPGRAWLRTTDGKTITVSEGENVGEYGKVIKIDAPNGLVLTSSGVTLR